MAEISSSSSSITLIQQKYDVFISFRGEDTRENIVSHLYAALQNKQIEAFIDDKLERGDDVSEALLRTIEESKISIIIFSEKYCSSTWCLGELVHIMECKKLDKQIVIPVFFKVDPSHVRKQLGPFGEALAQHKDHPMLGTWKDALTKASNLSGWNSQDTRSEAKLIKEITEDIFDKLYLASSSYNEGLVGISSRIEDIESELSTCSKDVKIIGIWGMGGIGKTTLAWAFFDKMFNQFDGHCFLENFREDSQRHGLHSLREKFLRDVFGDDNINVPRSRQPFIMNRLRHKKVLVVLDDVDNPCHLESLIGRHDWYDLFGRGSVIIITSRDKQVFQKGVEHIYEIPGLNDIDASSLFDLYAFKEKPQTDSHQWNLSRKAISYAKGNPLALQILGSHLCGMTKQEQESEMLKLERIPFKNIQQVLLVSYDGLDRDEKKLFLNIAFFFKGEHIDQVKCFHYACGGFAECGIRTLINKSLIKVVNNYVWMHNLLQEMGREIVYEECPEEPGKRSRLWDYADISHVFTENTGTESVMGISLYYHYKTLNIDSTAFNKMRNIEFLKVSSDIYPHQGLESLPDKLRFICWDNYPLRSLPMSFCPKNLVVFKMLYSHLQQLWNGRQDLVNLKKINLYYSRELIEIPDLSRATNLEHLDVRHCKRLQSLPQLPMKVKTIVADECLSLKTVGSPLWSDKEVFGDYNIRTFFDFSRCHKLDRNAQRNIAESIASRLLDSVASHCRATKENETIQINEVARVYYPGGDVADWFSYKAIGSSLTVELPPCWYKDKSCFVVFGIAINDDGWFSPAIYIKCSIGNKRVDNHSTTNYWLRFSYLDHIHKNQVLLSYNQLFMTNCSKRPKEADDVVEISIEFYFRFTGGEFGTIKVCGIHLLDTHDLKDRDHGLEVQPSSPGMVGTYLDPDYIEGPFHFFNLWAPSSENLTQKVSEIENLTQKVSEMTW